MSKRRKYLIGLLFCLGLLGLLIYFKNAFVVAWINGRPVFRTTLNREMSKTAGRQTLERLIVQQLIFQEAKKQKISVEPAVIEAELKQFEEIAKNQGSNLEELLKLQGLSKSDLMREISLQKLVEKLISDEVVVTPEEIGQFVSDNATLFSEDASPAAKEAAAREQLTQQKLNEKMQAWLDGLRQKATVINWL